jgi:hypothetical protein
LAGVLLGAYDHTPSRAWRHLDSCHYRGRLQVAVDQAALVGEGQRLAKGGKRRAAGGPSTFYSFSKVRRTNSSTARTSSMCMKPY